MAKAKRGRGGRVSNKNRKRKHFGAFNLSQISDEKFRAAVELARENSERHEDALKSVQASKLCETLFEWSKAAAGRTKRAEEWFADFAGEAYASVCACTYDNGEFRIHCANPVVAERLRQMSGGIQENSPRHWGISRVTIRLKYANELRS